VRLKHQAPALACRSEVGLPPPLCCLVLHDCGMRTLIDPIRPAVTVLCEQPCDLLKDGDPLVPLIDKASSSGATPIGGPIAHIGRLVARKVCQDTVAYFCELALCRGQPAPGFC